MAFSLDATLTSYYPVLGTVEGGPDDCSGRPLITLQQHQADPEAYPYASVAGDCDAWPDGQRVSLPDVDPDAVFRIVDTGGHFHGAGKVIRNPGREPFDVCVEPGSGFGVLASTVVVYPGDDFGRGVCPNSPQCGNYGAINLASVAAEPVGSTEPPGATNLVAGVIGVLLAAGIAAALA